MLSVGNLCLTLILFSAQVKALIGLGPVYTVSHLKGLVRLMVDALPKEEVCRAIDVICFSCTPYKHKLGVCETLIVYI